MTDFYDGFYDAKTALEAGVGRPVRTYMPPRNLIDQRTASVLNGMFDNYTCGPETDREVMNRFPMGVLSMPPWEYGRTDELRDLVMRGKSVVRHDPTDLF